MSDRKQRLLNLLNSGKRASECARELDISRQRIFQLLHDYGIDYVFYKRSRAHKNFSLRKRRKCLFCKKPFIIGKAGARVKFCSLECAGEWRKICSLVWHQDYYRTPKGKRYKKQRWQRQYERRDWSKTRACPTCGKGFAPRLLAPDMKFCSYQCYVNRGSHSLDKP